MKVTTLSGLFGHPSFIFIMLTTLAIIANILVGVRIISRDKRQKGYKIHRIIYYVVVIFYSIFLWVTYSFAKNGWLNYLVLAYILFAIPITRRINITLHAVIASVGLILVIAVATFSVL